MTLRVAQAVIALSGVPRRGRGMRLAGGESAPVGDRPWWHRHAVGALVLFGLLTAATGVWTTLRHALRFWMRLAVGSGVALGLVLVPTSMLAGNAAADRAWMLRA